MKLFFVIIFSVFWLSSASAQQVKVVDGDTLEVAGTTYRLHGIDTPEPGQKCSKPSGGTWCCGDKARKALEALVAGQNVSCDNRGTDDFNEL